MTQTADNATELPFEPAYERLQAISSRLNEDEVPVSEMCELFAEGKGLEIALTAFLDTQRERVEAIERGEGIRAFRITRAPAVAAEASDGEDLFDFENATVDPAPALAPAPSLPAGGADEDIPF
jgi:exonuclease VII small subunit